MKWSKYYDYLLYIIVALISCFFSADYNLLIKMITIDGLFSAVNFFKTFINRSLTNSQVLDESNSLYDGSTLDRYIYYGIQFIMYKILCYSLWQHNISILYYLIHFSIIPPLFNKILKDSLFERIRRKKEELVKLVISKQFASLIRFFSNMYLDKDIVIKHRELLPLLDNYKDTVNYFFEVIKNAAIIMIISYVKNYSPKFYYRVSKYAYGYKTGDKLVNYNTETAKKMLLDIINNKKYDQLLKPNVYQAIFYLYQVNEERTDFFRKIMINFNYNIAKIFMIWTLSSFCKFAPTAPIISVFLIAYRDNDSDASSLYDVQNIYKFVILLLSAIYGYLTNAYFMTSLMCQFGYSLIFNRVVESTLTYTIKKTNKLGMYFYDQNMAYTPQIIASYLYVIVFRTMMGFDSNILTLMQISHLIHIMMTNYDIKNCIISITMILSRQMSNFNIIHLLFNSSMICIGIVLIDLEMIDTVIKKSKSVYLVCYDEYNILKDIAKDKIDEYYNDPTSENVVVIKEESKDDMYIHLNEQQVIAHINVLELSNEVGINSQVFDLPKEEFIEAISTNEDVNIIERVDDNSKIVYKSIKKSLISSKQSTENSTSKRRSREGLVESSTNSDMHLMDGYY